MSPGSAQSYFVRTGERTWAATEHTGGGWSTTEQHISPMLGLLTHAIESERGSDGKTIVRITFDILGVVALEDTTAVAGGIAEPLPPPADVPAWDMTSLWPGGYIASLDVRRRPGAEPGRATAWVSTSVALVDDEPVSDTARFVGLVDTANGIGVRADPQQWLFPNVDLSLHLHRRPSGPWVGQDTSVTLGDDGLGVTSTALHDVRGPVGHAEQVLTVRPRS